MQKVVPAILTADVAELQRQLGALKGQAKWVQIDIMDGKFVPHVSVNISQLQEAYEFFNLEIHLMVEDPEKYLEDCRSIGAKRIVFHVEGASDPEKVLDRMREYPFQKGVALNPETPVSILSSLGKVETVLLLSVVPGEQGHAFVPSTLPKVAEVKQMLPQVLIGMDGGIDEGNIKEVFEAGADYVAVGSSIWKAQDSLVALKHLEELVQ